MGPTVGIGACTPSPSADSSELGIKERTAVDHAEVCGSPIVEEETTKHPPKDASEAVTGGHRLPSPTPELRLQNLWEPHLRTGQLCDSGQL